MTAKSPRRRKAKSGQRREAKSPQHKLGEAIRASRNEQGYSQEGFAAHAGMDRGYYGAIERGGFNFTIETLMRVATGLGEPAWEILRRADL
jgi:transcriptional regulator with XRE-family HTH domain